MKKWLLCFLLVLFTVLFSSCNYDCKHSVSEYITNEYYHWREYTCGCEIDFKMELHQNDDGDTLCDVCGFEVGLKVDKLMYCWYDYKDQYNSQKSASISLDVVDLSALVDVCNELTFTSEIPKYFKTKLRYCIRHYDTENDSFFVNGDEEYLSLTQEYTNKYADVFYTLDFAYMQVKQEYSTPTSQITKYAKLSLEQFTTIKNAFEVISEYFEPKEGTFALSDFELLIDEISVDDISMVRLIEENLNDNNIGYYNTTDVLVIESVLANAQSMKMISLTSGSVQMENSVKVTVEFTLKEGNVRSFVYYDTSSGDVYLYGERYFKLRNSFDDQKEKMELTKN